ncbi:unnamed protein product [Phaedon cochleariae]|uniref:Uncharacterized protein n=1 Tax=Phaedon cochleariae TaxID=80249 RepID=A0A9P0GW74_PHACE|nr:unnamed protein product [Phaedon cochleariae]
MAPKLYAVDLSPCVRAVLLSARALSLELELIETNLLKKDHLKPEFLQMNPQHTVPTLDDNGVIVWDSHAIMIYLVDKYGKGNAIYPSDLAQRATINQRLFFDTDLFSKACTITDKIVFEGMKVVPENLKVPLVKAYEFLETFLKNSTYIAGSQLTIADFSLWTTITNASSYVPVDAAKYPRMAAWIKNLESLPYSDLNGVGGRKFGELIASLLAKNKRTS